MEVIYSAKKVEQINDYFFIDTYKLNKYEMKRETITNNDNDFLTKWNESDNKYLHMKRWDEIIITKMSEEI